jgi:CHASE1-domain containing sensor protein
MTACIQAILVYLLTLPLWILALKNTLYNQRLRSCLGLSDQTAEG